MYDSEHATRPFSESSASKPPAVRHPQINFDLFGASAQPTTANPVPASPSRQLQAKTVTDSDSHGGETKVKEPRRFFGRHTASREPRGPRTMSPVSRRTEVLPADIGWAAGLLDGEGCIAIIKQGYTDPRRQATFRIGVQIAQADVSVLKEFEWIAGISGRIYSPKPRDKQTKTCHYLIYNGEKAYNLLDSLCKHLRRKREEAELAAEFRVNCEVHRHFGPKGCPEDIWQRRRWFYEKMADLKRQ